MHAECDCKDPVVHRHGKRRRRCVVCGQTWSIRSKPRGRKTVRISRSLLRRLLVDGENTRRLAKDCRRSVDTVRRRCRSECRRLVTEEALPRLPAGFDAFVLVVDGLWFRFGKRKWVLHDMAVKPVGIPTAFFLEPVMLAGEECAQSWQQALATIPPDVYGRIRALVADGFSGCKAVARRHRWVLQLCHQHLDARLLGRPGHRRRVRGGAVRSIAVEMVRQVRTTADGLQLAGLKQALGECARHPDLTARISGVIRRFLHDVELFRAYLDHRELELPTTTNSLECRHGQLRLTVRGINNPEAAALRVRSFTRLHPTVTCNGHKIPQN